MYAGMIGQTGEGVTMEPVIEFLCSEDPFAIACFVDEFEANISDINDDITNGGKRDIAAVFDAEVEVCKIGLCD